MFNSSVIQLPKFVTIIVTNFETITLGGRVPQRGRTMRQTEV